MELRRPDSRDLGRKKEKPTFERFSENRIAVQDHGIKIKSVSIDIAEAGLWTVKVNTFLEQNEKKSKPIAKDHMSPSVFKKKKVFSI